LDVDFVMSEGLFVYICYVDLVEVGDFVSVDGVVVEYCVFNDNFMMIEFIGLMVMVELSGNLLFVLVIFGVDCVVLL